MRPDLTFLEKYWAFYHFSANRIGMYGVATFCRKTTATPVSATLGFLGEDYAGSDQEGRVLVTDHGEFVLMNVYFPTGSGTSQLIYKVWFHNVIQETIEKLTRDGREVIVAGDFNFALAENDHFSPETSNSDTGMKVFSKHRGRTWLSNLISPFLDLCYDVFRQYHPNDSGCYTYWKDEERREKNEGARIDYFIATKGLTERMTTECKIESGVLGSDHCPLRLGTNVQQTVIPTDPPEQCAALTSEFEQDTSQRVLNDYFPVGKPRPALKTKRKEVDVTAQANPDTQEVSTNPGGFICHHSEPAKLAVVKKPGRNQGRPFYICRRAPGTKGDPEARCDFFQWADTNATAKQCECEKPAKLAAVKKEGRNHGRMFYSCARKGGKNCTFFMWADDEKKHGS